MTEVPLDSETEEHSRIRITNQDLYIDGKWISHIWQSGNHYGTFAVGCHFEGQSLMDVAEQVLDYRVDHAYRELDIARWRAMRSAGNESGRPLKRGIKTLTISVEVRITARRAATGR